MNIFILFEGNILKIKYTNIYVYGFHQFKNIKWSVINVKCYYADGKTVSVMSK